MPRFVLLFAAWVIGVLAVALGLGSLSLFSLARLTNRGVRAQGVVLALHPREHATFDYSYAVGGETFSQRGRPSPPNPSLDQLSVGQVLTVTYNPQQPAESVAGDPRYALQNDTISVALAAVALPSFIMLAVSRALRGRSARAARTRAA